MSVSQLHLLRLFCCLRPILIRALNGLLLLLPLTKESLVLLRPNVVATNVGACPKRSPAQVAVQLVIQDRKKSNVLLVLHISLHLLQSICWRGINVGLDFFFLAVLLDVSS